MSLPKKQFDGSQRPDSPQTNQVVALSDTGLTGQIRLGCDHCDRNDFDGVLELPKDWLNITEVQSWEESQRPVDSDEENRSVFEWQTHLGTCPECNAEEDRPTGNDVKSSDNSSDEVLLEDEPISVHPIIRQIIDRDCHVSWSNSEVVRHVVAKLKGGFQTFRNMSLVDRELLIDQCVRQHSGNLRLYVEVMSGLTRTTVPKTDAALPPSTMTGPQIITIMRKHHVTIAELANRTGITQKRIRQIRERGLQDPLTIRDWIQAITGKDPGPIPTPVSISRNTEKAECDFCGYPFIVGNEAWSYIDEVFCSLNCCRKSRNWLK